MKKNSLLILLQLCVLFLLKQLHGQPDDFRVVINEINYYGLPAGSFTSGDLEWIELFNRSPETLDLSGWSFVKGIAFTFPGGTSVPGGGFLVVCSNLDAFRSVWGDVEAVGNFGGRLSNSADRITLVNKDNLVVDSVLYRDAFPWPEGPNGNGATCELVDPEGENDLPSKWAASSTAGGTPGYQNSSACERVEVIPSGSTWRLWRGTEPPPSDGSTTWIEEGYDDTAWEAADAPLGFGDEEYYRTHLNQMRDNYSTVFLRRTFEVTGLAGFSDFRFCVDFDDGFVAYINGREVVRMNMGTSPVPAYEEEAASHHESGISSTWPVETFFFREGENTLAVVAANEDRDGADFLFDAALEGRRFPRYVSPPELLVNEAGYEMDGFWIELRNLSTVEIDLSDYSLGFDSLDIRRRMLSGTIGAGAFAVFPIAPDPPLSGTVVLTRGEEAQLVSSLKYTVSLGRSFGLRPDDPTQRSFLSGPTPAANNVAPDVQPVVVSEINYHPASGESRDEFIELYNAGDADVDLGGWRFTRGISFPFPEGVILASKEYLLVVPDSGYAAEAYPDINIIGNYSRNLDNAGERVCLEDANGVHVVDVSYADDGEWPRAADGPGQPPDDDDPYDPGGAGMTLELRDVRFDPSAGGAWVAETEGGTPGRKRRNADEEPPPVVYDFSFDPLFPEPEQAVHVTADVFSPEGVETVEVMWRYEGAGGWNPLLMADDGLNGDGEAGDGTWGVFLASLDRPGTVLFYLHCVGGNDAASFFPRIYNDLPFMLRVDSKQFPDSENGEFFRIVMTDEDLHELRDRSSRSDRLLPCAVFRDGELYQCGKIRYRGSSARSCDPRSYRIELTHEQTMPLAKFIYLNGCHAYNQFMGMRTFRRAGIPAPRVKLVSLGMEDGFWSRYVHMERMDEYFSAFHLTGDDGNLYRGERCGNRGSDLSYLGEDEGDYRCGYDKETNKSEQDWSDVVQLCRALNGEPENYLEEVHKIVDVDQWCRYFAVHTVLINQENSIYRQDGDDYFLYSRESDGRFILLPWDMDSVFQEPYERLFRPDLPVVRRFLTHPAFAPRYWYHLEKLIDRTFSEEAVKSDFDRSGGRLSGSFRSRFLDFRRERTEFIRRQLPREISFCSLITQDSSPLEPLIPQHAEWRYFKGTEDPSEGIEWAGTGFDDAAWESAIAGFGYGDNDDNTRFNDMRNGFTTVYIRTTFLPADIEDFPQYELLIDYDDGFVCYLNGEEIVRGNVNPDNTVVHHDETTDNSHEAGDPERFDLAPFADKVHEGENTLAIVGLNVRPSSSDFTLHPAVLPKDSTIQGSPAGCGSPVYVPEGAELVLQGMAPVSTTSFIDVNGSDASYDCVTGRWEAYFTGTVPDSLTVTARNFDGEAVDQCVIDVLRKQPVALPSAVNEDLVLTAAEGPYLVSGVVVNAGSVLTVEAGCELLTASAQALRVQGEMHAAGTEGNPVVFRRGAGASGDAPQIVVEGEGAVTLDRVDFTGGTSLPGTNDRISACQVESGALVVTGCTFSKIPFYCIVGRGGTIRVEESVFSDSGGGLLLMGADCDVAACEFTRIGPKDAIRQRSGGGLTVTDSSFHTMQRGGIDTTQPSVITGCSLMHASGAALVFSGASQCRVENTLCAASGTGLSIQGGAGVTAGHVTLADNGYALDVRSGGAGGTVCHVKNSIIWGNYSFLSLQGTPDVQLSYDLVEDPERDRVNGNLFDDPLFVDPEAGDYTIEAVSPALGRADDGSDLGAFQKTPEIRPVPGDMNNDRSVNLADVVVILSYLFDGGEPPWCMSLADTNNDENIDISDAVYLLKYLFSNGNPPAEPDAPCPVAEN